MAKTDPTMPGFSIRRALLRPEVLLPGILSLVWMPFTASAAQPGEQQPRSVEAQVRTGPVEVDGILDEPAWQEARPISEFVAGEPIEGVPATHQTEVRVLFDDEAIYVGLRMWDPEPGSIRRQLTRRDEESESYDFVEVAFDPDRDRRTAYAFRLTAAGVQVDRFRYDDVQVDEAWRAVWAGALHLDEQGWTAEFRIPLSQLRFEASEDPQSWGFNVTRRKVSTGEVSYLSLESRQRYGGVSAFAALDGLRLTERARNLEVAPFVLAGHETQPDVPDDPFRQGSDQMGQIGLDGRYGLGSTFVLDFTLNPDFGQVEVDPAVINLTAFETFFPEQRPFFTRDDRLFDFSLPGPANTLFYSRRIGRSPRGTGPAGADHSSVPRESRILGAGKLTGRTAGGLSAGALLAFTDQMTGRAYWEAEDRFEGFVAEPRTRYGVVRLRQDLRDGDSQVGAIVTDVGRELSDEPLVGRLPDRSHSVGVDFEHAWADQEWALSGHLTASRVQGTAEAMVRIQESSIHLFQRPDAPHLEVDSAATSVGGAHWHVNLTRRGGSRLTGSTWLGQRTPGFEINELGFSSSAERVYGGGRVQFSEITPGRFFREYSASIFTFQSFRNSVWEGGEAGRGRRGAWAGGPINGNLDATFLNFWEVEGSLGYSPSVLNDRITRGGPLMETPAERSAGVGLSSDPRASVSGGLGVEYTSAGAGGDELELEAELVYRPSARIQLELNPTWQRALDRVQYVAGLSDPSHGATYGRRYVFGELDRRTLSVDTRLSVVFSPTLTLQVFTQPLLSSGRYREYKQFTEPAGFAFDVLAKGEAASDPEGVRCVEGRSCIADGTLYLDFAGDGIPEAQLPDPNFTIGALRGNAVLRWEYRPGSQLFLVWQQRRRDEARLGTLSPSRDLRALLEAPTEHVFLLKASYWIDL